MIDLSFINDQNKLLGEFTKEIASKREKEILTQLSDLSKKGLIVIESNGGCFVRGHSENTIEYKETVQVKLKQQDYIDSLEKKINMIKEHLEFPFNSVDWLIKLNEIVNSNNNND